VIFFDLSSAAGINQPFLKKYRSFPARYDDAELKKNLCLIFYIRSLLPFYI
jgi:hypothetical protein